MAVLDYSLVWVHIVVGDMSSAQVAWRYYSHRESAAVALVYYRREVCYTRHMGLALAY